jgi:hypothetical protein
MFKSCCLLHCHVDYKNGCLSLSWRGDDLAFVNIESADRVESPLSGTGCLYCMYIPSYVCTCSTYQGPTDVLLVPSLTENVPRGICEGNFPSPGEEPTPSRKHKRKRGSVILPPQQHELAKLTSNANRKHSHGLDYKNKVVVFVFMCWFHE